MKTLSMMKRLMIIAALILTVQMVFGIGTQKVSAATPAAHTETQAAETTSVSGDSAHVETATEDQGVVGLLGLDWKLFIAQLINFGIVLFVLWKWVFGPVAKGLSNRTAKIESSLAKAQKIAEERQTFDSWKNGEIAEVRKEAAAILTKAKSEAETLKTDMLAQTKLEQEKLTDQAKQQIEQQKQIMVKEVKSEIADMVVSATQAVIKAKLDPKKDKELIDQALAQAGAQR